MGTPPAVGYVIAIAPRFSLCDLYRGIWLSRTPRPSFASNPPSSLLVGIDLLQYQAVQAFCFSNQAFLPPWMAKVSSSFNGRTICCVGKLNVWL